jgi:hypothetical protein
MLAKMADEMNMPDVAEMMKTYKAPPPSEEQVKAQQLELDGKQAEVELDKAKTVEALAKANEKNVNNKMNVLGLTNDMKDK